LTGARRDGEDFESPEDRRERAELLRLAFVDLRERADDFADFFVLLPFCLLVREAAALLRDLAATDAGVAAKATSSATKIPTARMTRIRSAISLESIVRSIASERDR
jgi:hypothetical protein